jgi:hypothetical protein
MLMSPLFILVFLVLAIGPALPLQSAYSVQPGVTKYLGSSYPQETLRYTSLGDLRGSIEGLIEDLSDIAGSTGEQVSGRIASSGVNLNDGTVEKVLLGNWSLDGQSNGPILVMEFDVVNYSNGVPQGSIDNFMIGNLTANSMQQTDGNTEIGGTVDVRQQQGNQQPQTWIDVEARLSLANKVLVLTLDEASDPGQIFAYSPIVGFITPST